MKKITITIILLAAVLINSEPALSQWQLISGITTERLFAVHAASYNNVFAGGKGGLLLHSTDGGDTWSEIIHDGQEDILAIYFPTASVGITAGGGEIMRSANGGQTWELIEADLNEEMADLSFPEPLTGYAAGTGGMLVRTTDGGLSWTEVSSGTNDDIVAVHFNTGNTGYLLTAAYELLITVDGGINWTTTQLSSSGAGWNDLYFLNPAHGYAVGAEGGIIETVDGGISWTDVLSPTGNDLLSIEFSDALNGHIAGDNGEILTTSDGGLTWISEVPVTDERLHDIHFSDSNFGFAVGREGVIVRYDFQTGQDEAGIYNSKDISAWPNPFHENLTIGLSGNMGSIREYKLYNTSGSLVLQGSPENRDGSSLELKTGSLPDGLYFLSLLDGSNKVRTVKLVRD